MSVADAFVRWGYRGAYWSARAYWFLRRPQTTSALVALWHGDRLLLVRSSYRSHCSLPGGFLRRGETAATGGLRELREELGMTVPAGALREAWRGSRRFEHRHDTITILEGTLDAPASVQIDHREIVWAGWATVEEAKRRVLLPHVREYLDGRRSSPLGR